MQVLPGPEAPCLPGGVGKPTLVYWFMSMWESENIEPPFPWLMWGEAMKVCLVGKGTPIDNGTRNFLGGGRPAVMLPLAGEWLAGLAAPPLRLFLGSFWARASLSFAFRQISFRGGNKSTFRGGKQAGLAWD